MTVETLNPPAADATGTDHQALDRLLRPRSVVIVGASDKPGALGASVLSNLSRNGFAGDIHLINPKRAEIGGPACHRSTPCPKAWMPPCSPSRARPCSTR